MKKAIIIGALCGAGVFYAGQWAYTTDAVEYVFLGLFALVFGTVGLAIWAVIYGGRP